MLKRNYDIASQNLVTTRQHLEETCKSFRDLEHRLSDQEEKFQAQAEKLANGESKLKWLELKENCPLTIINVLAVNQTNAELKAHLSRVEVERNQLADELEMSRKNALVAEERDRVRTEELEARLTELMTTENELREKVMASEVDYSERLKAGVNREKELQERLQKMQDEFELMRIQAETREQELATKLDVIQKEKEVVLRSQSWNEQDGASPQQQPTQQSSYRHSSPMKLTTENNWHVEAESLRCVLDLKMNEVAELRRQNQDLQRAADDLQKAQIRTSSLESKVEDLQFQLNVRMARER